MDPPKERKSLGATPHERAIDCWLYDMAGDNPLSQKSLDVMAASTSLALAYLRSNQRSPTGGAGVSEVPVGQGTSTPKRRVLNSPSEPHSVIWKNMTALRVGFVDDGVRTLACQACEGRIAAEPRSSPNSKSPPAPRIFMNDLPSLILMITVIVMILASSFELES